MDSGDNHADAAFMGRSAVLRHVIGRAVGRDNADFVGQAELQADIDGGLHGGQVTVAAHDDTDHRGAVFGQYRVPLNGRRSLQQLRMHVSLVECGQGALTFGACIPVRPSVSREIPWRHSKKTRRYDKQIHDRSGNHKRGHRRVDGYRQVS
jgi:hypothetical protein